MKASIRLIPLLTVFAICIHMLALGEGNAATDEMTPCHTATIPADRFNVGWWKERHFQKLAEAEDTKCDLLFIGDSITHMWESQSGDVWENYYGDRNAFNMGYSGDQTQHVLWRLDNGEMADFTPKVAVLMIGTNNTGHQHDWTAQTVADGIRAIIDRIHTNSPDTQVLLLGIFPRGASPYDKLRLRNDEINTLIAKYHDGEKIHYLDISYAFLAEHGQLSKETMPDFLHPNAFGYERWAEAMEPKLNELLNISRAPGTALNSARVPVSIYEPGVQI